jgi:hypothetical protein
VVQNHSKKKHWSNYCSSCSAVIKYIIAKTDAWGGAKLNRLQLGTIVKGLSQMLVNEFGKEIFTKLDQFQQLYPGILLRAETL